MACKRSAVRSRLAPPHSEPNRVRSVKSTCGAIAQLGERLHGMQEVSGSIPLSSTKFGTLATAGVFCLSGGGNVKHSLNKSANLCVK